MKSRSGSYVSEKETGVVRQRSEKSGTLADIAHESTLKSKKRSLLEALFAFPKKLIRTLCIKRDGRCHTFPGQGHQALAHV
jgi:hypothetical protein